MVAIQKSGTTFQTNIAKRYVPVVILSTNDNIKFLEKFKRGFKKAALWRQYRSQITTQQQQQQQQQHNSNNLDYLIDAVFRNIYRLFVLSFKDSNDDPTKKFFW